jgi:HEPN domain-containing protein
LKQIAGGGRPPLDLYYVEARYPNAIEDVIPAEFYSDRDAAEAVEMTRNVIDTVNRYFEDVQSQD